VISGYSFSPAYGFYDASGLLKVKGLPPSKVCLLLERAGEIYPLSWRNERKEEGAREKERREGRGEEWRGLGQEIRGLKDGRREEGGGKGAEITLHRKFWDGSSSGGIRCSPP
jgi:hypothetical protein